MSLQKSGVTGDSMCATRVVLHGARAEGIEIAVNREVTLRKVREMPHHLQFGHFRQFQIRASQK